MKNSIFIISFILALVSQFVLGQNKISFYKQNSYYIKEIKGAPEQVNWEYNQISQNIAYNAQVITPNLVAENFLNQIIITPGLTFFQGIVSPHDTSLFVYLERDMESLDYQLSLVNIENGSKKSLFNLRNRPDLRFAFKPIGWTYDPDIILLEALEFGSATEHEGIWEYNISNGVARQLNVNSKYMCTPFISDDLTYLYYSGTSEENRDQLHGMSDILYVFNLKNNEEILVYQENGVFISPLGWLKNNKTNSLKKKDVNQNKSQQPQLLTLKYPWQSGISRCVTRTILPAPGSACSGSACTPPSTGHTSGYAIDFGSFTSNDEYVTAAAGGTVVFAWFHVPGQGVSYGNLVKIKHSSDGTFAYYAHLNSIGVKVGDVVSQGQILGKAGFTGSVSPSGSGGRHLHFEIRNSVDGAKLQDYTFSECGCLPLPGYMCTSSNSLLTGTSDFSMSKHCLIATPISCGQTINGSLDGKQSGLNGVTTGDYSTIVGRSGCNNTWNDPGPEDVYKLITTTTGTITVTLTATGSSGQDLDVFLFSSCNTNSCVGSVTGGSGGSVTYSNAPPGTYYIVVDGYENIYNPQGLDPANNGSYGPYSLTVNCSTAGLPDLIVQNAQITPSTVSQGQQVTASCTNKNQGTGNASSSFTALWISADQNFNGDPTDRWLGDIPVPALNAGITSGLLSKQITIPLGPYAGTWYIMFGCDATNVVNEGPVGEGNNQVFVPINFSTTQTITVSSPNGGENWQKGQQYNITWSDNITENVKIELYKGGSLNSTIVSSTSSNGTYLWTVPTSLTDGNDYKVKITSVNNASINDFSDNIFTISSGCTLTSISPTNLSPGTVSGPGPIIPNTTPTLTWNAVPGATHYGVYVRDVVTNLFVVYDDCATTVATYTVPSGKLTNNGQYKWNMQANVSCGSCESLNAVAVYFQTPSTSTITVSPTSINYGNVTVGQSMDQNITITNQSSSTGTLSGNVTISGTDFSITSGGGSYSLSPGQSRTVTVRFAPTSTTNRDGTLSITHNATNQPSPINVALSGTGTPSSYTISGYVRTSGGIGISAVVMSGLPGNPSTDANGYYTATVNYGWTGTVTPTLNNYSFSPPSTQYSGVSSNQTTNYTGTVIVGVDNYSSIIPEQYFLYQNFPNPFNPSTTIRYDLPQGGMVSIRVYDMLGIEVKTLVNEYNSAGSYRVEFNASNLSSGTYFYRLTTENFTEIKKLILVK
ncbi:MAG: peptidoglycan DD-metalloendopeptidase family protein [Bacteroidetes bacterium]|nr:peptidoglycan DD-metalloendopeptidase family protein [Bacteroidota bacterium]